jgi:hypothetical protein
MSSKAEMLAEIQQLTGEIRQKEGIETKPDFSSRMSEEAHGESNVAVVDLLYANDGTGFHKDLPQMDEAFLAGVISVMKKRL